MLSSPLNNAHPGPQDLATPPKESDFEACPNQQKHSEEDSKESIIISGQSPSYPLIAKLPTTSSSPATCNDPSHQQPSSTGNERDVEVAQKIFDFSHKNTRLAFLRKVYAIIMAQFAYLTGFTAFLFYHSPTEHFVHSHPGFIVYAVLLVIVTVIVIVIVYCRKVALKFPINYVFLFISTIALSFLLGIFAIQSQSEKLLMVEGIMAVVFLALTLFTVQTKYDLTMKIGVVLVASVILVVFGILMIFLYSRALQFVASPLMVFLISVLFIGYIQLLMSGKRLSPEEYVLAALNLYLGILVLIVLVVATIMVMSQSSP